MSDTTWLCKGRRCSSADLAFILDEKRAEKRKRSVALYRAVAARRQDEKDQRALKAALRRLVRSQERDMRVSIRAMVKARRTGNGGRGRNRALETTLALGLPKTSRLRKGGVSSFHLRFRSRGLGSRRRDRSQIFREGETAKSLLYIVREAARAAGLEHGTCIATVAVQFAVAAIGVGLEDARPVGEVRLGVLAAAVARVVEKRSRRVSAAKGRVVSDVDPEPSDVGLDLGHHRDGRVVAVDALGGEDVLTCGCKDVLSRPMPEQGGTRRTDTTAQKWARDQCAPVA